MRQLRSCTLLLLLVHATGCASILHGTHTQVSVATTVPGALIVVDGAPVGQAPGIVPIDHRMDHTLVVHADGYQDYAARLTSTVGAGWIVLDVLVGCVSLFIPLIVDAATGAWSSLTPTTVQAYLPPLGQPVIPPPGYGAPLGQPVMEPPTNGPVIVEQR